MAIGQDVAIYLFAAVAIAYGVYSCVKGEITYGIEGGSSEDDRTLSGRRARLVSALLVVSGLVLFFSSTALLAYPCS